MNTKNFTMFPAYPFSKEMTEIDDDYASSDFENDSREIEEDLNEPEDEDDFDEEGTELLPNSLPRDSVEHSTGDDPDFIRNIGVEEEVSYTGSQS